MRAAIQVPLSFEATQRPAHADGLIRAKQCAAEGLCLFCESPAKNTKGRKRLICGRLCCFRAYHRAYGRDRRLRGLLPDVYPYTRTFRELGRLIAKLEAEAG